MDLRNLSSTPNQLDSVIQRRPSLSSLSSTSGYESSTYGNNAHLMSSSHASNPQMPTLRQSTGLNRLYSGVMDNPSNPNLIAPAAMAPAVHNDVLPWVEQQKQQQMLNGNPLDSGKKELLPEMQMSSRKPPQSPTSAALMASISSVTANTSGAMDEDDDDDELIPTAIVIKNIPFAIKKEQLLDVMTKLNLPLPYAFNYHFDNGVFRGLAFANFTSTDETSMVVNHLNGREIGGRKLRVEYKKMLPLQERERIEREKREKRGQLEEQHRTASNASLASLLSTASTTAATKNLSVSGQQFSTQTERVFVQFPSAANSTPPPPPPEVNFNDPEVLELYSQLLTYRDDNSTLIFELAFSANLSLGQRKVISLLCAYLNLLELYDNGYIIIRRKPGQQTIQQRQQSASLNSHVLQQQTPSLALHQHLQQSQLQNGVVNLHSSSMMNLNQLPALLNYGQSSHNANPHAPELLRSQSQSALQVPRLRQQTTTPIQQQFSQYQPPANLHQKHSSGSQGKYQSYGNYAQGAPAAPNQAQPSMGTPTSSAAALLRSSSNRSFVDVRASNLNGSFPNTHAVTDSPTSQHQAVHTPGLYQGPTQGFFSGGQISQPGTPLGNQDLGNRFAPFGQHGNLGGSVTSLQGATGAHEEFPMNDTLSNKLKGLNLSNGYEQQKPSAGIWGPKK